MRSIGLSRSSPSKCGHRPDRVFCVGAQRALLRVQRRLLDLAIMPAAVGDPMNWNGLDAGGRVSFSATPARLLSIQ